MYSCFRRLGLRCVALSLLAGCGSPPAPILQLNISGGDPMGIELRVSVTKEGKTAAVTFTRDSTNTYVFKTNGSPPLMMGAPSSSMVALDLPLATSGPVTVQAAVWGGMPPAAPVLLTGACVNTTIVDGVINMLNLALVSGPITCK